MRSNVAISIREDFTWRMADSYRPWIWKFLEGVAHRSRYFATEVRIPVRLLAMNVSMKDLRTLLGILGFTSLSPYEINHGENEVGVI